MFWTRTLIFSPTRTCASANIDTLRGPKIEILKIGFGSSSCKTCSVFLHIDYLCKSRILASLERKKSEEARIATQQFGDASVWIKAYISFVYSLAAYCSSLIDLNCPRQFFITFFFLFSDFIFGDLLLTQKCFLHVFRFSKNISKKAIKKQIESARMKEMKWK